MTIRALLTITLIAGACGKDEGGGEEPEARPRRNPKLELINFKGQVLPKLPKVDGITWEGKLTDARRVIMAVPKGWEEAKDFAGRFTPPADTFGAGTKLNAGVTCSGQCIVKDWEEAVNERHALYREKKDRYEVLRDDKLQEPTGQLLIAKNTSGEPTIHISLATWQKTATRYYVCEVTLVGEKATAFITVEDGPLSLV